MSRRADPEQIYLARRAAVLSILTTSGVSAERAELLVCQWEANAQAAGIPRLEATFWEGASGWTIGRVPKQGTGPRLVSRLPVSLSQAPGDEEPNAAPRGRTQRQEGSR